MGAAIIKGVEPAVTGAAEPIPPSSHAQSFYREAVRELWSEESRDARRFA